MRILITAKGTQVVNEIEVMTNTAQSLNTISTTKRRNFTSSHYHITKSKKKKFNIITNSSSFYNKSIQRNNSSIKNDRTQYIDTDKGHLTASELKQAKKIDLKVSKVLFPKNFVEKYENDSKQTSNIIATSGNFLPSLANSSHLSSSKEDELEQLNKLYSFKEIIPEKTVTKIKLNMIKESTQKAKQSRITEKNFRSVYQAETDLEKLDEILDYPKVTPNKLSLIKYLNESKNLNPISLKTLVESNPERINRVNKMCQILYHDEEQQRLLHDIIKGKIKQKVASDKVDFQNKIKEMKSEVECIKDRLNKYSHRLDDRERYRDIHNDLVLHCWNKKDYDRFNKKSKIKKKLLSSDINNDSVFS